MDAASDLSFDGICRTCMHVIAEKGTFAATTAAQSEVRCYSIFDTVAECGTMRIVELLATTTPQIQVNLRDELPQKICQECLHLLQSVYRFQQMCIKSDQQMREILAKRYPDVKLIMPALFTEFIAETKELSILEAKGGDIETGAANNSLEVPLSNDPLQNEQFVKMEECFDVDEYNSGVKTRGASEAGTKLVDPSLLIEAGTPTTAHESEATSDEVSCKEDVDSDWTSDMPNFRARKASYCKKSDITDQKERINEATSKHSCNHCNKSFSCRRYLTTHLKRHEKWEERKNLPEKPLHTDQLLHFKCDICARRFNKPESLNKHKQTHTEKPEREEKKKIYACDLCDDTYCSKQSLRYHKNRRHSQEPIAAPTPHVCEICNKGFQVRAGLAQHLRTHTSEKPFLCSLCGKSYKSSSILKQHLLRHSDVKGFECPECPQKFACRSGLSNHRHIHRTVKAHNCDVCGASFATGDQLKKHKIYHTGEKPYKCEYCDMRFVLMEKQRRHMRTHTGEKPYKCRYCERAFAQSNDLVKHLRNHLGENVYKCELCPSAFRLACELRLHFASHRNDDEETRARNLLALKEEDASLRVNLRAA